MSKDRIHVALAITTGLDPQTILDGLRLMFILDPTKGRIESAITAAVPDGSAAVIIQGGIGHLDGAFEAHRGDDSSLRLYPLPSATWGADHDATPGTDREEGNPLPSRRGLPPISDRDIARIAEQAATVYARNGWMWAASPDGPGCLYTPGPADIALAIKERLAEMEPDSRVSSGRLALDWSLDEDSGTDQIRVSLELGTLYPARPAAGESAGR